MKSKLVASALLGLALAGLAAGRAQTEAAGPNNAHVPQTIVPYLSHGAGVWVDRRPGGRCPVPVPARPRRPRAFTTLAPSASFQGGGYGGRLDRRPPSC